MFKMAMPYPPACTSFPTSKPSNSALVPTFTNRPITASLSSRGAIFPVGRGLALLATRTLADFASAPLPGSERGDRAHLPFVVLRIHVCEIRPLFRQVIQREDGRDRADRYACPAIDALYRIDVQLIRALEIRFVFLGVDAIH